ncbi:MAG: hypothetical protein KJ607_09555, partial [Bacteroidetes bacterium]|nr:hypothetical protein [Bacteroidota bacterium]
MNKNQKYKTITIKYYSDVDDTIKHIRRIILENYNDRAVVELAGMLRGKTVSESAENIWNWIRKNVHYKNDEPGKEQLRRPQRTIAEGVGDCDDMAILAGSLLMNMGIKHEHLVTAYSEIGQFQHIYTVCYDESGKRYVIDAVPESLYFNYEAKPIVDLKRITMRLEELAGLGAAINEAAENAVLDVTGELTQNFDDALLEGLGEIGEESVEELMQIEEDLLGRLTILDDESDADGAEVVRTDPDTLKQSILKSQLERTRKNLESEISDPSLMSKVANNSKELSYVNNILQKWDDPVARQEAIDQAVSANSLYKNYYKSVALGLESVGIDGLGLIDNDDENIILADIGDLGKRKAKRKGRLTTRIKEKLKSAGKKLKKPFKQAVKLIKKFDPTAATLRATALVAFRTNVKDIASKMRVGYYTQAEALDRGYTVAQWQKFVDGKNKAEKLWEKAGGSVSVLKKAIMAGAKKKEAPLTGLGELGVAPAIIMAIINIFSGLVTAIKDRKAKKASAAEKEAGIDEPGADEP